MRLTTTTTTTPPPPPLTARGPGSWKSEPRDWGAMTPVSCGRCGAAPPECARRRNRFRLRAEGLEFQHDIERRDTGTRQIASCLACRGRWEALPVGRFYSVALLWRAGREVNSYVTQNGPPPRAVAGGRGWPQNRRGRVQPQHANARGAAKPNIPRQRASPRRLWLANNG